MFFLYSPLEQFEISRIFLIFTNFNLCLLVFGFFFITLSYFVMQNLSCLHRPWLYYILIHFLEEVDDIVSSNGGVLGPIYFPYFFFIFITLLAFNIFGIVPYGFTLTSHILLTFFYSFTFFFCINFVSIRKHSFKIFSLFLPSNTPYAIMPLIVPIEFISYIMRMFSLAIRLFANMMAGHTLLHILTGFLMLALQKTSFWFFGILPISLLMIIVGLEVSSAYLQVYVFVTLSCLYLNDTYDVEH